MHNIQVIFQKELATYFNSSVAYITLVVFALITGWFFSITFFLINESDLRALFSVVPWVFVFFIPALTMGLIARERSSGTLEFLTTFPFTDDHIVYGKYLAALTLVGVALLFTAVHFFTLLTVGTKVDIGSVMCGYFGLLLLAAAFTAIGIFGSAITNNQITAFIISFMLILVLFMLDKILIFLPVGLATVVQYVSVEYHLSNISRGVLDSRNLVYFGSLIGLFLILTIKVLEIRKWR